jgi:hypothetical protein
VAFVTALVLSGSFYAWAGEGRTVGFGEKPLAFAYNACDYLARPGMPARVIVANIGQSAVCTYHLRADQRQFLVSRIEPARADAFERYVYGISGLLQGRLDWDTPFAIDFSKPDEFPSILIEHSLGRAVENLARDPRWRLAYRDELASVFLPRGVP